MPLKYDPERDHGNLEATPALRTLCEELAFARQAIRGWKDTEDELKQQIMDILGGFPSASHGHETYVRIRHVKQERFDSAEFRADHPDLYGSYVRETEHVRVEV
jgi:hypothetical protein